jgi:lipopolysaccharide export system permease protein
MRLLDRYLLRELLVPLGYCLGGFFIFWVAFNLFSELDDLHEHKLRAAEILQYYLAKSPEFVVFVLPMALLLALLYALTNHSRHHEIAAMRAAGVSLWRLCVPYLGVGLTASLCLFALNEFFVPDSSERAERILNKRVQSVKKGSLPSAGLANLRERRTWLAGQYNQNTSEMVNPQVLWTLPDESQLWLVAARAIRKQGVWTFYNARVYTATSDTNSMLEPSMQTNVLAMPQFKETPEEIQSEINISKGMSPRGRNKADIPIAQLVDYLRLHPQPTASVKAWLYTKLHGRLALPWTCLVVVLIATPFGAATGRRNVFVGVASSMMICFVYFVLQQFGLALGTGGYMPSWLAAWFPNLSFSIAGLWMMSRIP